MRSECRWAGSKTGTAVKPSNTVHHCATLCITVQEMSCGKICNVFTLKGTYYNHHFLGP